MKLELNSLVHTDLLEVVDYYFNSDKASLAIEFYAEFRRCIDQVITRPDSFPIYTKHFRRVNLNRFPYHFLYRIVDTKIVRIIVVRHDRRNPRFGINRN